tara:strand:+ start:402 stop:1346 length:945 start_codon:yes stop_codon:yes gene_type:complete
MSQKLNISKINFDKLVTIILPVKNGEPLVIDAIESINRQTINPAKVILADNNSKDRTIEIFKNRLNKSINLEIFKSNNDIGAMDNFFRCIDKVETEFFCWLAHDDYIADNWLEENLKVHFQNKDCITSFGKTVFFSESGEKVLPTGITNKMNVPRPYKKGNLMKFILERQLFGVFYEFGLNNVALFKKALLSEEKIKKLNSIKCGGDTCLVLSLLSEGSLCTTNKTKFYRRLRLDSDGCEVSKTNLLYRIFILELPWSYFRDVTDWISDTYNKKKTPILILLILTSRLQSVKKILRRLLYEFKNLTKKILIKKY